MPSNASDLGISNDLWELLVRCWNDDRTKRPQIKEVLQHLSQGPAQESIFPPPKPPRVPSRESTLESGTQRYGSGP